MCVDTVRISNQLRLDQSVLCDWQLITSGIGRYCMNAKRGTGLPRLTYYPNPPQGPRLVAEWSMVSLVEGGKPVLLDAESVMFGTMQAYEYIAGMIDLDDDFDDWRVSRVDYYWQWRVDRPADYMMALEGCQLARYARTSYGRDGISWRNEGSKIRRKVMMYDKLLQLGVNKGGILRFEVQNFGSAVIDMAERIHQVEPTVHYMLTASMAKDCINYWLDELGVHSIGFGQGAPLRSRILDELGPNRVAKALYFLDVYTNAGLQAVRDGVMSRSSYYYWKNILSEHGLLSDSENLGGLPPLTLE